MTPDEYQQLATASVADLEAKQEKIAEVILFQADIDLSRATICFMDGEDVFCGGGHSSDRELGPRVAVLDVGVGKSVPGARLPRKLDHAEAARRNDR